MKIYSNKTCNCFKKLVLFVSVLLISFSFDSCKDEYIYDDQEPENLGSSIYDYLNDNGNYTYTVRLIEDLKYKDVLQVTGSKTLFVANDDAYKEFFQNNEWNVRKYEDLSLAQKKSLLNFSLLNNPYTIVKLSNYNSAGILIEETAMRQETSLAPIDSLSFEKGDALPTSPFWDYHRENGIHLLKDNTQ